MAAAADAAERDGNPDAAARWRARAAAQRSVAAKLPHGGRPNVEWQVRRGNEAFSRAAPSTERQGHGV
jgi:hypothetical protein